MLTKSDLKAIRDLTLELINDSAESLKKEIKDQVLTRLDRIIGELKTMREEQTVTAGRQSENTDTVEDHEKRISKLEQASPTT